MLFDMLEYRNQLNKHNITVFYSGPVWAEGIESLGDTVRKRLDYDDAPMSVSQSVFSVFVEQMNNMLMYSAERECFETVSGKNKDAPCGIFTLGISNDTYFIQCGNLVKSESIEALKNRIDYLNSLNKSDIRQFYREQIKSDCKSAESRGAGLGLIEIAKRASAPIEYSFTPVMEGFAFYALLVTIKQEAK